MSGKLVGELGSSIFCNYYRTFFLPMSLNWTYWKSMVARDQFWASLNKRTITTDKVIYRTLSPIQYPYTSLLIYDFELFNETQKCSISRPPG